MRLEALFLLAFALVSSASKQCSPIYVRWPRVKLNVAPAADGAFSLTACRSACTNEEDPLRSGIEQQCSGFNHKQGPNQYTHNCQLFPREKVQHVDGYIEADDRYSYYWKYCINTNRNCGGDYAFTFLSDRYMVESEISRLYFSATLEECLAECLNEKAFLCRSVSFNRTDGGCHLSQQNQLSKPSLIKLNNNPNYRIDYYENNCYNMSDSFHFDYKCEEDGIRVSVKSKFPYSGALYGLYDFFSCRVEPKEETEFGFLFPYPTLSKNCSDSIRYKGNDMVLEVVLSTDGVEPLYFITPDDLTYQARCPIKQAAQPSLDSSPYSDTSVHNDSSSTKSTAEFAASAHALFSMLANNSALVAESQPVVIQKTTTKDTFPLPLLSTTAKPHMSDEKKEDQQKKVASTTTKPSTITSKPVSSSFKATITSTVPVSSTSALSFSSSSTTTTTSKPPTSESTTTTPKPTTKPVTTASVHFSSSKSTSSPSSTMTVASSTTPQPSPTTLSAVLPTSSSSAPLTFSESPASPKNESADSRFSAHLTFPTPNTIHMETSFNKPTTKDIYKLPDLSAIDAAKTTVAVEGSSSTSSSTTTTTVPKPSPTTQSTTTAVPTTTTTKATTTTTTTVATTTTTTPSTTTSTRTTTTEALTTTSTALVLPPTRASPLANDSGDAKPPAPAAAPGHVGSTKEPISFDVYHNGQPVQAVVVGSRITLSFTPYLAIDPKFISITGCQVEPIGSIFEWEKEPLAIVKDACPADHVGLVCPPQRTDYGWRVTVESFRYQTTAQVQYTCLVRICPFAPCPETKCQPVEGCEDQQREDILQSSLKSVFASLSGGRGETSVAQFGTDQGRIGSESSSSASNRPPFGRNFISNFRKQDERSASTAAFGDRRRPQGHQTTRRPELRGGSPLLRPNRQLGLQNGIRQEVKFLHMTTMVTVLNGASTGPF
ncbi:hypothetical protein L596_028321 [Steinernema carpocapsae]|uniref:ZP domain-containing protein n=1 Tax=Steinernema carpocapsae TaxID=34508 RepID=A0A4V5ZXU8_STECR|nr:hypothetical protein L596_028321 [Steinernema carpocapsae]